MFSNDILGFVTEVLGRPCHPFSAIFPLRRCEFLALRKLGVPEHLLEGTASSPSVCFGDLLKNKVGYKHDTASGILLDWASSDDFFPELFVPHAMRAYRTLLSNVFEMLQTVRGDIFALSPQDTHFFGADISTNARDPLRYKFLEFLSKLKGVYAVQRSRARRLAAVREFRESDGSGKIERGRMLDPAEEESGKLFQSMLDGLRVQVWEPLKADFTRWCAENHLSVDPRNLLLTLGEDSAAELMKRITKEDAANLTTMLLIYLQCDFVPLRSQILRDSLVHEYKLNLISQQIRLTMDKRRGFKTLAYQGGSSVPATTTWLLPKGMTEALQYYKMVCRPLLLGGLSSTSMFLSRKGESLQQSEIYSMFNGLGRQWLGIPRFGTHICRSFVISQKAHSGEINASNLVEIGSLMQTSAATLHTNYVSRINGNSSEQLADRIFGGASN
ncbi:unnamed protein product, partial [Phaeothamnion confervicola]